MVTFTARRCKAELVVPARPTPHATMALSDLDDYIVHRHYFPFVELFRRRPTATGGQCQDDPAKAVKVALAEALVHYYPIAGRLRELPDGKLVVDCTAEGVVFVEADADVRLEDFGEPLSLPIPCVEELLCDAVGDTRVVVAKPLVFVQVTRLKCGGFVIGFHISHCVADGFGMIQFIGAIGDLGRGEAVPTVLPVWERELLMAQMTRYPASKELHKGAGSSKTDDVMLSTPPENMVSRYFVFGPREIAALRGHVPSQLGQRASKFKLLVAVMWRCRTVALGYEAHQRVHLCIPVNSRGIIGKHGRPYFPSGYYGNALLYTIVKATVEELCGGSLGHSLQLVHKAKLDMTEENLRSTVNSLALSRGAPSTFQRVYAVSDLTRLGEDDFDFGWAQRIGGVPLEGATSFHLRCKNADGGESVAVSMLLPRPAMEKFQEQMGIWLEKPTLHSNM